MSENTEDTVSMGTKNLETSDSNITCEPCRRLKTPSSRVRSATKFCTFCTEDLCDVCIDHHQASKASSDHVLIDKSEETVRSNAGLPPCSIFCIQHPSKKLELFCLDHTTLCCIKCMTKKHRHCERLLTIDEAAIGIKESKICSNILKTLERCDQQIADTVTKGKLAIELCQSQSKAALELVGQTREKINKSLDRLESNFKREFPIFCNKNVNEMKVKLNAFEKQKSIVGNSQDLLQNKIKHSTDTEVLMEANRLQKVCSETEKFISDIKNKIPDFTIDFQLNECFANFSKHFSDFGTYEVKNSDTCLKSSLVACNIEPMQTIKLLDKSCITGVKFLADGNIALIDSRFNALYFYGIDSKKIVEIGIQDTPWDVELFDNNILAVSFQERPYIQFVDVTKRKLRKEVELNEPKRGIAIYNQKLILSSKTKISVAEATGKELCTFVADDPLYVCVDRRGRLYYRDHSNKLVCADLNGHVLFTYTNQDLKVITGLTCDFENNVYVAGFGSHNIHQLSDGKLIQIFSGNGLSKPRAIYLQEDGNIMLVSNSEGKEVKIFQLVPNAKYQK